MRVLLPQSWSVSLRYGPRLNEHLAVKGGTSGRLTWLGQSSSVAGCSVPWKLHKVLLPKDVSRPKSCSGKMFSYPMFWASGDPFRVSAVITNMVGGVGVGVILPIVSHTGRLGPKRVRHEVQLAVPKFIRELGRGSNFK